MSATLKNAIRAVNRTALMLGSISTLAISSAALAQEEGALMEEIEVTGIRGALKQAMDTKRFSNATVDAVSSEDIGKFPDSDVGEALGRVPGVSVSRQFGQGSSVSIRGASATLTNTLLNGHAVATTGWYDQQDIDRSFNYSLMPSELVGDIEVYKSSQADLVEGGVGGTIIVNTRKALDLDANTVYLGAKADYGTVSEQWDPEVSGLYSWKNDAETFGILVAGSYKETEYLRTGLETLNNWSDVSSNSFLQDREREAFNIGVQWAPTDALTLGVEYMSLDLKANNTNSTLFMTNNASECDAGLKANGMCAGRTITAADAAGEVQTGTDPDTGAPVFSSTGIRGFSGSYVREAEMSSETFNFDFAYEGNGYTIDGQIGQTEAEGGTNITGRHQDTIGTFEDFIGSYSSTGSTYDVNPARKSFTAEDFANDPQGIPNWSMSSQPNTDEEFYAQINAEFEVDLGVISSVKVGATYADHEVEQSTTSYGSDNAYAGASLSSLYSGQQDSGGGFKVPKPKFGSSLASVKAAAAAYGGYYNYSGFGTVEEENVALYAMANFEGDGFRGNFGFRYIGTEAESQYHAFDGVSNPSGQAGVQYYQDVKSTDKDSYNDVLPSINVAFDLSDDVILRTSASQVISRPNYADMFATNAQSGFRNEDATDNQITRGNIGLAPTKATQADLGLEWYYGEGNMVSATYFIKDFSSFSTDSRETDVSLGIIDPVIVQANIDNGTSFDPDSWTIVDKTNGSGGRIEGLELQLQHSWDSGFGVSTNYTYVDAGSPAEFYADRIGQFSDSSEHTVNAVGFWENDTFSARAAYNWRSEYMIRESGFYSNRMHDDFGTLDLTFGWNITDNLGVSLEVANLLEEDSIQTGEADPSSINPDVTVKSDLQGGHPAWSFDGEARYKLGVNYSF